MRHLVRGLAALAILAGCGGSEPEGDDAGSRSSSTSAGEERTAPPPGRREPARGAYVRRVDALCEDVQPELARIMAALVRARDAARAGHASAPSTFETFTALLRRASVITARFEERLGAMEPPDGERAFHGDFLRSVERAEANLGRQVSAARARDAVRLRELSVQGSVISAERSGLIRGHGGFRFCGSG